MFPVTKFYEVNKVVKLPNTDSTIVILNKTESIVFLGRVTLSVKRGSVRVYGHTLTQSSAPVALYAPVSYSAITIEPVETSIKETIDPSIEKHIKNQLKSNKNLSAVIVLEPISDYSDNASSNNLTTAPFGIDGFYPVSDANTPGILLPEGMSSFISQLDNFPTILLCGSQNSGKSTTGRYLLNYLLNKCEKVAYLETDVGQTEFTPSGLISLSIVREPVFGPPHTHQRSPIKSFFYGDTNPRFDPNYYTTCILQLMNYYNEHIRPLNVPLVVNTHGWIIGQGLNILVKTIQTVQPSAILQLCTDKVPRIDFSFWEGYNPKTFALTSIAQKIPENSTGVQRRNWAIQSYLEGSILENKVYSVPLKNLRMFVLNQSVAPSKTLYAMHYSVVALCVDYQEYELAPEEQQFITENSLPIILKTTPMCECVGYGIVHNIDMNQRIMQIVTPVSPEKLQNVNTILKGAIETPQLATFGRSYILPNFIAGENTGAFPMKARPHLQRRALQ